MLYTIMDLLENLACCIDTWHIHPLQVAWPGAYTTSDKRPMPEKGSAT